MRARTGLWEPRVGNDPRRPGPKRATARPVDASAASEMASTSNCPEDLAACLAEEDKSLPLAKGESEGVPVLGPTRRPVLSTGHLARATPRSRFRQHTPRPKDLAAPVSHRSRSRE